MAAPTAPPHPAYQLQWSAPPPPAPAVAGADEVRTIFITGLPADVKERELQNLLRWLPGYEASQINFKEPMPPMGFALFTSVQYAVGAKAAVEGLVFDADLNAILHVEMAKKNLYVKRGGGSDSGSFDQSKRLRTGGDYTHTVYANTVPYPPPAPMWGPPAYMPPPTPYDPYGGYPVPQPGSYPVPQAGNYPVPQAANYPVPQVAMPPPLALPAPNVYAPVQNIKDNPPCNTLFIGNLGESTIEEELKGLFSVQPGYKQLKVLRQERNTVCFIEFEDLSSATAVHKNLQGAVLPSSGRGGMRIQFSKNPFGRRKDWINGAAPAGNGNPVYQQ